MNSNRDALHDLTRAASDYCNKHDIEYWDACGPLRDRTYGISLGGVFIKVINPKWVSSRRERQLNFLEQFDALMGKYPDWSDLNFYSLLYEADDVSGK